MTKFRNLKKMNLNVRLLRKLYIYIFNVNCLFGKRVKINFFYDLQIHKAKRFGITLIGIIIDLIIIS